MNGQGVIAFRARWWQQYVYAVDLNLYGWIAWAHEVMGEPRVWHVA